jgi:hypothetical protein
VLILFDNNVPRGLARALIAHTVTEARERGWALLKNGDLIKAGEAAGFDVFVTADKNIRYQQNHMVRTIAMVVLTEQRWTQVKKRLSEIAAAVDAATPSSYVEVEIPFR